jgi:hypothetical protein
MPDKIITFDNADEKDHYLYDDEPFRLVTWNGSSFQNKGFKDQDMVISKFEGFRTAGWTKLSLIQHGQFTIRSIGLNSFWDEPELTMRFLAFNVSQNMEVEKTFKVKCIEGQWDTCLFGNEFADIDYLIFNEVGPRRSLKGYSFNKIELEY